MAERKFGALAELRRRSEPETEALVEEATPDSASHSSSRAEIPKGKGRPPGKRSNPDWKPRTILMRVKTHRRVSRLLLDEEDGPDLSELVDKLLTDWISRQT